MFPAPRAVTETDATRRAISIEPSSLRAMYRSKDRKSINVGPFQSDSTKLTSCKKAIATLKRPFKAPSPIGDGVGSSSSHLPGRTPAKRIRTADDSDEIESVRRADHDVRKGESPAKPAIQACFTVESPISVYCGRAGKADSSSAIVSLVSHQFV
jgi:hypothetical protein